MKSWSEPRLMPPRTLTHLTIRPRPLQHIRHPPLPFRIQPIQRQRSPTLSPQPRLFIRQNRQNLQLDTHQIGLIPRITQQNDTILGRQQRMKNIRCSIIHRHTSRIPGIKEFFGDVILGDAVFDGDADAILAEESVFVVSGVLEGGQSRLSQEGIIEGGADAGGGFA